MTQTQDAPPFKWAFDGHPTMEKWMRRFANQGCGLNMIEWSEFCNDMHGVITRAPAPVDHVKSPDTSPAHVKNQAEIEQVDVEKLKIEAKKFMHKWIKAGIKDEPYRVEMLIDELIRRGFRMQGDGWMPIETAPRDGTLFVCRHKSKPHVTFEAAIFKECESWEMPEEYEVLQNMTTDEPLDGDWEDYEWMPLPNSPQASGSGHAHPASMNQHDAPPDTVDGGE